MSQIIFDMDDLERQLKVLSVKHRIAFAASCCERLLPNYRAFSRMENWGKPEVLSLAVDEIWNSILTLSLSQSRLKELKTECDKVIPDTEDFSTIYTSAALDAGTAVTTTLDCYLTGEPRLAAEVASIARDTVDMFVQDHNNMNYSDPGFEQQILNNPLMVAELEKQRSDLTELLRTSELSAEFLTGIRASSYNNGVSNIGVSSS